MKVAATSREDVVRAKDESAKSRQKAAGGLATALSTDKRGRSYWSSIFQSNEVYHHLAMFKGEKESTQQGRELPLDRYKESRELVSKIPKLNVPPATLQIEVRPNMNYSDLPRIAGFKSTMTIANGLSAPKVITAKGTDGRPYKQLVSRNHGASFRPSITLTKESYRNAHTQPRHSYIQSLAALDAFWSHGVCPEHCPTASLGHASSREVLSK